MTRLVSYSEAEIDLVFALTRSRVTIGRGVANMIQLPHEKVSKQHAVISRSDERWSIEDLKSSNGTFVNGQRIEQSELKDRDRVRIGPHEFHFELDVPSEDFVPAYIIDPSTRVTEKTILDEGSKKES